MIGNVPQYASSHTWEFSVEPPNDAIRETGLLILNFLIEVLLQIIILRGDILDQAYKRNILAAAQK